MYHVESKRIVGVSPDTVAMSSNMDHSSNIKWWLFALFQVRHVLKLRNWSILPDR